MLRDVLFAAIAVLSPVLLLQWIIIRRQTPTDCAEEDTPVVPVVPAATWYLDKDGKIHSTKMNWKK